MYLKKPRGAILLREAPNRDFTVTARLATQFSMGRQARQFRLPVDEEETSLALWRVNTPLVRSGEPEPRNTKTLIEGTGPVKPEARRSIPASIFTPHHPKSRFLGFAVKLGRHPLHLSPHHSGSELRPP